MAKGSERVVNTALKRKFHIDLLKVIAIYLVLLNHTGDLGFSYFRQVTNPVGYWLSLFLTVFIKAAVPLFFMVSGALLLPKEETIADVIKKRFLKYLLVLVVFSLVSYLYTIRADIHQFDLGYFVKTLYSGEHTVAYWYLYYYLGYLIALPLLRKLAKAMSDQDYRYMLAAILILNLFPFAEGLIWGGEISLNDNFIFFFSVSNAYYPLLGYYLEHRLLEKDFNRKNLFCLVIASCVAIGLTGIMTDYRCANLADMAEGKWQLYLSSLICIPAITVYYIARYISLRCTVKPVIGKIFYIAGNCSFGIFLLEQVYRSVTKPVFSYLQPYISTLPACLIWILGACLLGCVVTVIMKKIPFLKKLV